MPTVELEDLNSVYNTRVNVAVAIFTEGIRNEETVAKALYY